jgi:hypothetical protein
MCLSLIVYIGFEVLQGWFLNTASLELAQTISQPSLEVSALKGYQLRIERIQRPIYRIWAWAFIFSAVTGIFGASILMFAFVHTLMRML